MSETLPVPPQPGDCISSPPWHRLKFEFQACSKETLDVSFGCPKVRAGESEDNNQLLERDPIRYTCSWSLPSSATTKFALPGNASSGDASYLLVSIKYQLTAVLLRGAGGLPVAKVSKHIAILDNSDGIQPPTCIADYPGEYRLSTTATTCSSSIARKLVATISHRQPGLPPPRFLVRANEPHALVFRRSQKHATTLVPIEVTIIESQRSGDADIVTSSHVKITWRLQQSRFSAFDGLRETPTRQRVHSGKSKVAHKTTLEAKSTYTCQVDRWRWATVSDDLSSRGSPSNPTDLDLSLKSVRATGETDGRLDRNPLSQVPGGVDNVLPPCPPLRPPTSTPEPAIEPASIPTPTSTRTTTIYLPVSISLSSLKAPTSRTTYMVVRYSLSIDFRMRLDSAATRKAFCTSDEEQQRHTRLFRRNSRGKDRRRSWIAEAHLVVPLQLVYMCDDDVESSWSGARTLKGQLGGTTAESRAFDGRGIATDLDRTSSRRGGQRTGLGASTGISTTAATGRQERLPTYSKSTAERRTSVAL